jgi:hypothetical protein
MRGLNLKIQEINDKNYFFSQVIKFLNNVAAKFTIQKLGSKVSLKG